MNQVLDVLRVVLSIIFLTYSSWSDYKKREVSNKVWMFFAPLGFTLTLLQFLLFGSQEMLFQYGLSFLITSVFCITFFYAGAFGGADAKALICLSLAVPIYPASFPKVSALSGSFSSFFPISVFCNAVLFAALSVFYILLRNLLWKQKTGRKLFAGLENASFGRKLLTMLCGYKISIYELQRKKYSYPLEDIETDESGKTRRKLLLVPDDEKRAEIIERILKAVEEGKTSTDVWATPGLPMLIFITVGFIFALVFGDVIWIFLRFFFTSR